MKNINLIVFLLILILLAVVGLNMRYKKECFPEIPDTVQEVTTYDYLMGHPDQNIRGIMAGLSQQSVEVQNKIKEVLSSMNQFISRMNLEGSDRYVSTVTFLSNANRNSLNVSNKTYQQLGFDARDDNNNFMYYNDNADKISRFLTGPVQTILRLRDKQYTDAAGQDGETLASTTRDLEYETSRYLNTLATNIKAQSSYNSAISDNTQAQNKNKDAADNLSNAIKATQDLEAAYQSLKNVGRNLNLLQNLADPSGTVKPEDIPDQQVKTAEIGGLTGTPFKYICPPGHQINSLYVRTGSWLDGMNFGCTNGQRSPHLGGWGGGPYLFENNSGFNKLNAAQHWNNFASRLNFQSLNKTSYGTSGDIALIKNLDCPVGKMIGLEGQKAGNYVGKFNFICGAGKN